MQDITAADARAVFAYDPITGVITRKQGRHSAQLGPICSRDNGDGYGRVTFKGKRVYLHRLAWLLHYGEWPQNQVDHIDGDRTNNSITNLRDVDHTANAQNVHVAKGRTGLLGVSWDRERQKRAKGPKSRTTSPRPSGFREEGKGVPRPAQWGGAEPRR